MNSEDEGQLSFESEVEMLKQPKMSYTRDFLLSFSDLDICKKLPSGFDVSILSELEDAFISTNEWQRSAGGFTLHSSKRGDYGSLPPNRLEGSASYSRGNSGRWEVRSTVSSNRDGDLHTDQESFIQDSGRPLGTQPRRFLQQPEHDGLLGSGSFPRPPGYVGNSASKSRGTSHFQLNRNTEPYQPPRPHKDIPFLRKHNNDSLNDETFGSTEFTIEDRAVEERKRRESFELMRKEQQKALHEKQKQAPDNQKEKLDGNIVALSDNSIDKGDIANRNNKRHDSPLLSQNHSSKSSIVRASTSRPLVPPGFAGPRDLNPSVLPSATTFAAQDSFIVMEENLPLDDTEKDQENGNHSDPSIHTTVEKNGSKSTSNHILDNNTEMLAIQSSDLVVKDSMDIEHVIGMDSGLHKDNGIWEEEEAAFKRKEIRPDVTPSLYSISMLEKFFSSALSSWDIEPTRSKNGGPKGHKDIVKPASSESSKFASWFLEADSKPTEDFSSKDLFTSIVNDDKVVSPSSTFTYDKANEQVPSSLSFESYDTKTKLYDPSPTSLKVGIPEHYSQGDKPDLGPGVLTCEDLEQFILAEVKDSSSTGNHFIVGPRPAANGEKEKQKADVDDHASQHLLSLLQSSAKNDTEMASVASAKLDIGFSDDGMKDINYSLKLGTGDEATYCNSETAPNLDKTLTLQALFGAAFVSELKSADAPVSVQRVSDDRIKGTASSSSLGLPFQHAGHDFISSNLGNYHYEKPMREGDIILLHHNQEANAPYYHHLQGRTSFQSPHVNNQMRPLFPELDHLTNEKQPLNFIGPDATHNDFPSNMLPNNAFSHAGASRYGNSRYHLVLPQMPIQGNFPPQFQAQGFPRGRPLSHPVSRMQNYMPEMNYVHNIPLHHRQSNYGGIGMGMAGPVAEGVGGSHPEAFQRLIDIELRANGKQVRTPTGRVLGISSPEFDMTSRYR